MSLSCCVLTSNYSSPVFLHLSFILSLPLISVSATPSLPLTHFMSPFVAISHSPLFTSFLICFFFFFESWPIFMFLPFPPHVLFIHSSHLTHFFVCFFCCCHPLCRCRRSRSLILCPFPFLSSSHLFLSLIPQLFPLSFFSFLLSILLLSIFFSFISTFPASFSPFPLLSQFHSSLSSPLSSFFIPPIFPFTHRSLVSSFTSFPFLFVFPLPSFLLLFSCLSPLLFAVHLSLILSLPNYFPPYITHLCSCVISQLSCSYLLFP